ncbi:glycosyltransferase family 4 protein [Gloeothece verrucosa]|uniref:Glycosyl transferase group 1 n=1 Tax=Gloeothece verrucosa (strain PCC 7822) TaxID=497965 RepID=E0U831_GLOV7|nr:glycosyltransferase family 4 protein [Gloeothece verrucosa]ADN17236.1 glycosyl transferase group 1 [Gloeothece verrucosa PCC 7822]
MKLLYTLTTYPPAIGGAQLHQHLLAQQLNKNHDIQVVSHWSQNRTDWLLGTTLKAPEESKDYIIDEIKVHQFGLSKQDKLKLLPYLPIYYPLMDIALPKIASCIQQYLSPYAEKANLIHNVRIGREGISYASLQAARKKNIPFVLTPVHHPRWKGWRYRAYNKLYQLADAVIALTQAEKQIFIDLGVSPDKIFVTGHGPILSNTADAKTFRQHYQIDEPIVLFLAQHYPYKGYQQLLQATSLVWEKIPETQFVFVGPTVAQSESYFSLFKDKRIHRLGAVSLQEKTNALAACTLLCVPSTQESFGGVYTEAWSFGKPVIGCNIPAVGEVVTNGVDGYLVSQSAPDIADSICQLLLNPSQAQAMGAAGQKKVELNFTWKRLAQKTEQVYLNLI